MSPRLRNPLHGSWHPWSLAKRITDFLLTLIAIIFISLNKRIFSRLVAHYTGLRDPRALAAWSRRIALAFCAAGTLLLFIAFIFLLASRWDTLLFIAAAIACYLLAGAALTRVMWGLPAAFRRNGRLAGALRRTWEVIRHGAP